MAVKQNKLVSAIIGFWFDYYCVPGQLEREIKHHRGS